MPTSTGIRGDRTFFNRIMIANSTAASATESRMGSSTVFVSAKRGIGVGTGVDISTIAPMTGASVAGTRVGVALGSAVGVAVGASVGVGVGSSVGSGVGVAVGTGVLKASKETPFSISPSVSLPTMVW